jgi:hypothetical protein
MDVKTIDDLRANPKNPRTINKHDFDALVKAMREFGDLSGIVFNIRTGQLVGGHQRTQAFKKLGGQKDVTITARFDTPNEQGTVAIGFVGFGNERFNYREVDWNIDREAAANIAANRIQGQFDLDLLAEITYEISQSENAAQLMELTGQSENEIKRLLKMSGAIDEPEDEQNIDNDDTEKLEFALTREQLEIVDEALGHIKATRELQAEKTSSINGAALYTMARDYLNKLHGLEPSPEPLPLPEPAPIQAV